MKSYKFENYLDDKKLPIGKKIRLYRKRAGYSQFKLEVELGLGFAAISRIETGTVNPTKETLIKLIDKLNIDLYTAIEILGLDKNRFINKT